MIKKLTLAASLSTDMPTALFRIPELEIKGQRYSAADRIPLGCTARQYVTDVLRENQEDYDEETVLMIRAFLSGCIFMV